MKKVLFILITVLSGFSVQAQNPSKTSLLWEISGKGLKQPSYIFGTFHLMCKEEFAISDELKTKLITTKQFYGELDLDDPHLQTELMQLITLQGRTIESYMNANNFAEMNTAFQNITGVPLTQFNHYKPFFCLSFLTLKTVPCSNFVQPETELMQLAKSHHMQILGLETVAEQIQAIDAQPLEEQITGLQNMVLNFDSTKNVMREMIAVYKQKDPEALYDYIQKQGNDGMDEEALLVKRNLDWVPKMQKTMAEKASFFAVGAGHLGGKTGILALLRAKGYTLLPVKY